VPVSSQLASTVGHVIENDDCACQQSTAGAYSWPLTLFVPVATTSRLAVRRSRSGESVGGSSAPSPCDRRLQVLHRGLRAETLA